MNDVMRVLLTRRYEHFMRWATYPQETSTGGGKNATPWLLELLKRKPPKLAAVALANKIAGIAWKMMMTGEVCRGNAALPQACAA